MAMPTRRRLVQLTAGGIVPLRSHGLPEHNCRRQRHPAW
jgi:hypothetical protein